MAGLINLSMDFSCIYDSFKDSFQLFATEATQTNLGGGNPGYVSIGLAEEDISFGDVTPGIVIIQNLDSTNFIKYGPKSGGVMVEFLKLSAGRFAIIEMQGSAIIRAIADTAAVKVRIRGYNV